MFEVDPLVCAKCGGEMRIVSIILEPKVIKKILDHIRKGDEAQSRAPPSPQTPPAAA